MHFSNDQSVILGVALLALPSVAAPIPGPFEHFPGAPTIGIVRGPNGIKFPGSVIGSGATSKSISQAPSSAEQFPNQQENRIYKQGSHHKPSTSHQAPRVYPGAIAGNDKIPRQYGEELENPLAGSVASSKIPIEPPQPRAAIAKALSNSQTPRTKKIKAFSHESHELIPHPVPEAVHRFTEGPSEFNTKIQEGTVRIPLRRPEFTKQHDTRAIEEEPPSRSDKIVGGLNKVGDAANAVTGIVQTGETLWEAGKEVYDHFKHKSNSKSKGSAENQ